MIRIFDITLKDWLQLVRDRKIFLFLLIMPVAFTFLFGYAFGGFGGGEDPRLPVGFLDQDRSRISQKRQELLDDSEVIRLEAPIWSTPASLEARVVAEKLAAASIVPKGYGTALLQGGRSRLELIADTGLPAGQSVESEALSAILRLDSAVRTALILEQVTGDRAPFDYTFQQALEAWEDPPIRVSEVKSTALSQEASSNETLAHTSPGFMLQFAIASLLASGQILVGERKSRALQRLFTTAVPRGFILLGHYLAIFGLIFAQFLVLTTFGQLVLGVNYLNAPLATLLVAFSSALCIASLGLLIGALAKSEEQAVIFSLIPMFVLAGLGGAWVPLEVTGETFRLVGHLSPVAWALDGFKNISIRGLGVGSVLLPAGVLVGYALLFFGLAAWRFARVEEY